MYDITPVFFHFHFSYKTCQLRMLLSRNDKKIRTGCKFLQDAFQIRSLFHQSKLKFFLDNPFITFFNIFFLCIRDIKALFFDHFKLKPKDISISYQNHLYMTSRNYDKKGHHIGGYIGGYIVGPNNSNRGSNIWIKAN